MQRLRQDRRLLRLRSSVWLERLQASNAAPLLSVHRCLHSSDAPASSPPPGSAAAAAASARPPSWVDSFAPASSRPFLRLARVEAPVGTALLLLPCYWSLAMAAPAGCLPDAKLLALFGAGAFLLRGFGCTVNDLWDVELDRKVARTRARPLPSGDVTFRAASAFALAQLTAGGVVWLQLPPLCQALSLSVLPVVAVYPLAKRFTFWPQAVLGIAFNWGIPTGFAAALGSLPLSQVAPLFVAGWGWTMVYDTLYAHQDKADDVAAGVKSTALRFGDNTPSWLAGFSVLMTSGLAASGAASGLGWPFYAGVAATGAHLAWQVGTVDLSNPSDCASKFRSNAALGALVLASIVAGKLAS